MSSIDATPRYRNFSSNMPLSMAATPRAASSLITVEKEPERDPEEDCFMCRQAHVYVKPIGMHQERRVAQRHPPPLTRAQIDQLSRKKHLTKQEARKLLQCYFPEIKDVKYFQLHKYHSCCYDPQHLNLCKNHITALQHERQQHPHNHDDDQYKEYERNGNPPNRVSFVRIKIEPTKGIPTRFLGPTALPESLAEMLIKQVNRVEEKKPAPSFHSNDQSQPYQLRRVNHGDQTDDEDDDGDEDDGDKEDEGGEEEEEENEGQTDDDNPDTRVTGKIMSESSKNGGRKKPKKVKVKTSTTAGDIIIEDIDELNRLNLNQRTLNHQSKFKKPKKKKITKKKGAQDGHKSKLNHWEIRALDQAQQDPCNCRHQVMRIEGDEVVYDWCRCKDNQHKELMEQRKSIPDPIPSPPPPQEPKVPKTPKTPKAQTPPTPPPSQPKPPKPKPRKIRRRSIGIDATEPPPTTELALAYDPSSVDYDTIQETIYYRTSSGRLIKPEMTNAFTYDTMPPAITRMTLDPNDPVRNKAEVLYMTPSGQLQPYEGGGPVSHRGQISNALILSNPGSVYNGHARINTDHSTPTNRSAAAMPVLRLPPSVASSRRNFSADTHNNTMNNTDYQPAEFTLATITPDKNVRKPDSRRSTTSGPRDSPANVSQRSTASSSQEPLRNVPVPLKQRSTKPTYSNLEPTPDYGRESSIVANRRWFDQPLGDQNLRPVHDGQYGLIAGLTNGQQNATNKIQVPEYHEYMDTNAQKHNDKNCTIS